MNVTTRQKLRLFVDKTSRHWIVRDPEECYWIIPTEEEESEGLQPFVLSEDAELEPVPEHYKYTLGLPD